MFWASALEKRIGPIRFPLWINGWGG